MRDLYQAFEDSRRLSRQRGFTLIELLVVVAIIAILAAIAIPQFNKYRVNAAKKACLADIRNAITMCAAALADNVSKKECEGGTDYPKETYNAKDISVSVNTTTGTIEASGTCKGAAADITITCTSDQFSIQCTE